MTAMEKKILIVEDEAIIAADLRRIINKHGWTALPPCNNQKQALINIKEQSPDLVLIDINLKGKGNGIGIGSFLLESDSIPFIYVTSLTDTLTFDEVKKTRPMGFIIKPFSPRDITSAIEIALYNHKHRKLDPVRNKIVPNSQVPFKLRKVTNFINKNLDKRLNVETLAAMTEWKRYHFIRNFKKYVGTTPYQYVLELKISKAKSLLQETDLPISSIAYDIGFQSHSSFCVTFQKHANMSAENFRNLSRIKTQELC